MAAVRPSVTAQQRYHMYLTKARSHQHLDLQFLRYLALYKLCYPDSNFSFDLLQVAWFSALQKERIGLTLYLVTFLKRAFV